MDNFYLLVVVCLLVGSLWLVVRCWLLVVVCCFLVFVVGGVLFVDCC